MGAAHCGEAKCATPVVACASFAPGAACAAGSCQDCAAAAPSQVRGIYFSPASLMSGMNIYEDPMEINHPIPRNPVHFSGIGAVPSGWAKSMSTSVPEGFLVLGGDAAIIEETSSGADGLPSARRVLLALPDWAVDTQRARALTELPEPTLVCRLRRMFKPSFSGEVIFEFDVPTGEDLNSRLSRCGCLDQRATKHMLRDLLVVVMSFQAMPPLHLWGLLDGSMVFLEQSKGRVSGLLPLGCLLSLAGARSVATTLPRFQSRLAPEFARALTTNDLKVFRSKDGRLGADAYAVATVALEALVQKMQPPSMLTPETVARHRKMMIDALPECAVDLLQKALYEDVNWRLSAQDTLAHPWLSSGSSSQSLQVA
eukprot:gnl/TRDRNA2_/TRDRNA2_94490_c0_seq1.p1 gnl/TRDRNA2_/TRDRNA2_94490_c0~~gnl/TRDRNA2_/TRDRNA2_94490_c0_seq1.p1  ORF type:complete len:370 (-),score=45.97 gnl/TRDRNA2_/TRDRNA2_94490_c0_seq1:101-1210(-)